MNYSISDELQAAILQSGQNVPNNQGQADGETLQTDTKINSNEVNEPKKDYSSFDNYSKKRVTLIGYLLGVKEDTLSSEAFDEEYLKKIKGKKEIETIRALCSLRQNFLHSYDKIFRERQAQGPFAQFDKMDQYIDTAALKYLNNLKLEPLQYGVQINDFTKHIANLNQLIEEKIDGIHYYIPEWINWEYIKELFIMPDCSSGPKGCYYSSKTKAAQINAKIHEQRKDFYDHINFYPFHVYMNWNVKKRQDDYGNILFNDSKFLKLLYASHYDTFKGDDYVIDAKDAVKNDVYDFVELAQNVAIFVDCENVDPYRFAATLKNLDETKINKIKKVVLYDDVNTTNAWDILKNVLHLPVEHEEVERIKDDKSLVDHALSIGVTRSFYAEKTESVIIASSDSDFWGLIRYLPEVKFLVMNERGKTSEIVIDRLNDNKIPHCYMDEFAQDAIQPYKNIVLKKNLQAILDGFNESGNLEFISVDEMLEAIFNRASISGHFRQMDKEKQDFYNKYLKKLRLVIEDKDGEKKFKIEID
jgi:hypothetical protein